MTGNIGLYAGELVIINVDATSLSFAVVGLPVLEQYAGCTWRPICLDTARYSNQIIYYYQKAVKQYEDE